MRRAPQEGVGPELLLLGALGVASLVVWAVGPRLSRRARRLARWGLVAGGSVVLLAVAALVIPDSPEHALPIAAGVTLSVAPVRQAHLRLPVQVVVVGGMGALLLASGASGVQAALAVMLLGFVAWLASVLSLSLVQARHSQSVARQAAERRAELLSAVRDLSGRSATEAARTVVGTLRSLGFAVAVVSRVRGDLLVPLALEGLSPSPPVRVDEGLVGDAVTRNRSVVAEDYSSDSRRSLRGADLGTTLVVPIRIDGEPVGVIVVAQHRAGPLPPDDAEVVEVLAAHLAGVLETERRVDRQQELLDRMRSLDSMRERLVTEVSEEIRDPLTVVRGIAETLAGHGEHLSAQRREQLLSRFEEQTGQLRATIDALLDFSRFQADHPLPAPGLVRVGDLLGPLAEEASPSEDVDAVVRTDPRLVTRALEIVQGITLVSRVEARAEREVRVRLHVASDVAAPRSRLLLGLAERLVVAAGGGWRQHDGVIELWLPFEPPAGESGASPAEGEAP